MPACEAWLRSPAGGDYPAAVASVAELLAVADREVNTTESPPGSNYVARYHNWYGAQPGWSWCAIWCSWVLDQVGISGLKHHYTPTGVGIFKSIGRWFSTPEPGDLVYFDFPDAVWRVQHVGFVVRPEPSGWVRTVEGNTSAGDAGSQDNGGGVFRRLRNPAHIVGYGRPDYAAGGIDMAELDELTKVSLKTLQQAEWGTAEAHEARVLAARASSRAGTAVRLLREQGKALRGQAKALRAIGADVDALQALDEAADEIERGADEADQLADQAGEDVRRAEVARNQRS